MEENMKKLGNLIASLKDNLKDESIILSISSLKGGDNFANIYYLC